MSVISQQTRLYIPEFGYETTHGKQSIDKSNGKIYDRTFEIWQFEDEFTVTLIPTLPPYYPDDDIDSYFAVSRKARKIQYRARLEFDVAGEVHVPSKDFRGWLRTQENFNYVAVYLNKEVASITWINTPTLLDTSASQITIKDDDDNILFTESLNRDSIVLKIPDSIWGIQKVSGAIVATLSNGKDEILINRIPTVVSYTSLVLKKNNPTDTIRLSCRGKIWDRGATLDYINSEEPEWLYHSHDTPYRQRLKPPVDEVINADFALISPQVPQTVKRESTDWRISGRI